MTRHPLTDREVQIIRLIWEGLTSQAIGERLAISRRTVEVHRLNVYRRWRVHNAVQLMKKAMAEKVIRV